MIMKKMYQRVTNRHPKYVTNKYFIGSKPEWKDEADIKKQSEKNRANR